MAMNGVRVHQKADRNGRRLIRVWILSSMILLASASPFAYDSYTGRLGMIGPQPDIEIQKSGRIIKVPPGGNLQAAIERAESGDTVELQAGAVYNGTVTLPKKAFNDYVTIRSSLADKLPVNSTVTPKHKPLMATIVAGYLGRPAVTAQKGSHHYRFVGIEFTASTSTFNYGLIELGRGERADDLPHHLEVDRSYIHPHKAGVARRGIALNSAETTIKNSYISGFGFAGEETQGICGWTGTRNVKILNNYIEGGAENIMFGGADPDAADLIPSDIEIRGNHLNKPAEWAEKVTVKTLFELKNARRVLFAGNLLTNNWKGSAFRITVRNQDGSAPFSVIEDVTIRDNVIDRAGEGINILGMDDTHPSRTLRGLRIENNIFLNITGGGPVEGSGYFIQVADGQDITITNNTVFNTGNITTFYGAAPRNFSFRDNVTGHGSYGVHGPIDLRSELSRQMFRDNIFMNLNGIPAGDYAFPDGNTLVPSAGEVGFMDLQASDLRLKLNSKFRAKEPGRLSPGASLSPEQMPKSLSGL